ncbi:hypothetical protein LDO52_03330 [Acinetobacter pseudolwoffii]|uniref:hypothetical protein n=1 Tax=Acinetobacter pseudolwoffii TaxID=2053287 RepID=UPI001CE1C8BF|nr:hypothetical protein [Acinetobacter pseudolwoffii]UBX53013.1 hypothetical protein LDO52_03330 [Acinetobacter pseudolwoffii]
MTQIKDLFKFRKNYLAMTIGLILLPSAHAMQELSDSSLSDTTGEGVALVLDDFKMVFQGPKDISAGSSYARGIENPGQADTGFIRIIPTGENYEKLGERIYNKTYDLAYTNAYLGAQASTGYATIYKTTYDSIFTPKYSELETRYTKDIRATEEAKQPELRSQLVQAYYDSPLMQQYYDQRYDDYYNGAGNTSPGINYEIVNDGTTRHSLTPLRPNKSKEYAEANTREMIELLYGNRAGVTIPNSPFLQTTQFGTSGRTSVIDPTVAAYIQSQITQKTDAGKLQAKVEADALAAPEAEKKRLELYQLLVKEATKIAEEEAAKASVVKLRTKADVFIYGLALSKSDDSLSTRYSNQGFSWGSADNPWLFRAGTENVKQFKDAAKDVGYIALEAPLAKIAPDESDNNIKLGFWSDIFARELNSSNVVDPVTGGPTSGLDTNYRLRTQFVANGLSLNGSQVRLFQTLESDNKDYNQTLGMASIVRLNTNDRPETLSSSDSNLNSKGIRLSTAAKTDALDGNVPTPALNGSAAPIFHDSEGLYLYSPNINLVLGNMYQPFVVGSEGNNIILEVTRIPNIPAIYNQIYQNYGGGLGESDLKGSTCNVYSCGTPIKNNASDATVLYQGRNATHSSISIGTTERIPGTNLLRAKDGPNSTGVVFKSTDGISKSFGSAVIDGVLIQHLKIRTTGL